MLHSRIVIACCRETILPVHTIAPLAFQHFLRQLLRCLELDVSAPDRSVSIPFSSADVCLIKIEIAAISVKPSMGAILIDRRSAPCSEALGICPGIFLVACRIVVRIFCAPEGHFLCDRAPIISSADRFAHVDEGSDTGDRFDLCQHVDDIGLILKVGILRSLPIDHEDHLAEIRLHRVDEVDRFCISSAAAGIMIDTHLLAEGECLLNLSLEVIGHHCGALSCLDDHEVTCNLFQIDALLPSGDVYSVHIYSPPFLY